MENTEPTKPFAVLTVDYGPFGGCLWRRLSGRHDARRLIGDLRWPRTDWAGDRGSQRPGE